MKPKGLTATAGLAMLGLLGAAPAGSAGEEFTSHAFARSSGGAEGPLFTRLTPDLTGIEVDNAYDDPAMWGSRFREYTGGSLGTGVAVGDYDGDGYVDIYVSLKTKAGRLYRNLGDWRFEDVTEEAGLTHKGSLMGWLKRTISSDEAVVWNHGAVFADVDNDGLLDLYVCRSAAPNLLYMNKGNGSFAEEASKRGLDMVDGSVVGAFADYDRDGWLDALILTNQMDGTEAEGRQDRLFRNQGGGRFVEVTAAAGLSGKTFGHAVNWFDFDGDGWLDFYIANDYSGPDYLYRNNGDGTFTDVIATVAPHTAYSSMGADTADVNNDGYIDLFVGDMAATSREKDRRRTPPALGEEVLMRAARNQEAPQFTRNALLINTGRNYFREGAYWAGVAATDWTWSARFEDFDNDGWADLHVTNGMVREANNSDLLSRMVRSLSERQRIAVMLRAPRLEESNLAFRNQKGEGFLPVTEEWGLADVGVSFGASTGDFDNDGDLDLVYIDHDGGLSVYRNDVAGRRRIQVRLKGRRSNAFGIGAVVRVVSAGGLQSRTLATSRGYASGSEVVAHFGLGTDSIVEELVVEWPSGVKQVIANLPADAAYLLVEPDAEEAPAIQPDPISTLFREASESMGLAVVDGANLAGPEKEQPLLPFRTDRRGPGVAVGDIDGDGSDDLVIGATTGSPARLLRWSDGRFVEERLEGVAAGGVEHGPLLLFDGDANGTIDLLVTKASARLSGWPGEFYPVLYSNDGAGRFAATEALPKIALNAGAACLADIDLDGDLDLFIGGRSTPGRYPLAPRSALLLNDGGRFVEVKDSPELNSIGLVKSALFRDVDQDGRPDLILALEWDFVRYFRNEGGGRFSDRTKEAGFDSGGRGWWNGLACADFNGDGRPDFAVGNLGLNTSYTASPEYPATLFFGSFGQSGEKTVIEGVYDDDGVLYPRRSRGAIGSRLGHVLSRFPRVDDFAKASMEEVFGAKAMKEAEAFRADNFRSGVFLSQPDGRYRFAEFPRLAQLGPIQDLVAEDFDGDGRMDICATQNSDIAIPTFQGGVGLVLAGNGDGTFEELAPAKSGVVLPGFGRSMVKIDPGDEGRPSLFLTRHGGTSQYLRNDAASARWIKIRLKGDERNPEAIGASLTLKMSSGREVYFENGLGGGWLSQSAPMVFAAVAKDERIDSAVVKWPDGQISEHVNAPDEGVWLLVRQ